jgi:putative membrane protein
MNLIARLLINMAAILLIAYFLPGLIWVDGLWSALVAALLLGIVNAILRPILIFLTLPLTLLTLGLFLLVINGFMLWLVAVLVKGFHVNGFWGAVFGSILISIVSWVLSGILHSSKRTRQNRTSGS